MWQIIIIFTYYILHITYYISWQSLCSNARKMPALCRWGFQEYPHYGIIVHQTLHQKNERVHRIH